MKSILLALTVSLICLAPFKANAFLDDIETEYAIKRAFIKEIQEAGTGKTYREPVFKYREKSVQPRAMTASINTGKMNLDGLIIRTSAKYGVDPALVKALVHAESNFNPHAVSPKGAVGLTQVMPQTAEELGVRPSALTIPHINLDAGTRYLTLQLERFDSLKKALVAYNAGPNVAAKVKRPEDLRMIPSETRLYVRRIISLYAMYKASGFGVES